MRTALAALLFFVTASGSVYALVDDRQITIRSAADVSTKRQALIQFIWGSTGFPADRLPQLPVLKNDLSPVGPLPNLERVDTLSVVMDHGTTSYAHHFIPVYRNSRLVVLHLGHVPTFNDSVVPADDSYGMRRTLEGLLGDGYSVLAVYMPYRAQFSTSIQVSDSSQKKIHNVLFDIPSYYPATGSSMKYFLEPIAAYLNYLSSRSAEDDFPSYTEYDMVGFSGGGWAATVYSAIDPRIRISIPVAGSIPLYLRAGDAIGDLEQTLDAFYSIAGYPDLYVLGSFGEGRRQIQVLNRRDWCCFGELHHDFMLSGGLPYDETVRAYETSVRDRLAAMGDTDVFRLEVNEAATGHMVAWDAIYDTILPELNDGRRYVGAADGNDSAAKGRNTLPLVALGGPPISANLPPAAGVPAVVARSGGVYDIFYRSDRNQLVHASRTAGAWSAPELIGGKILGDPAAVSLSAGTYDVLALGVDYRLFHHRWDGTNITTEPVSEWVKGLGQPVVIPSAPDRLDVFYRSWNRQLYHAAKTGDAAWSIESIGGSMLDFPTAVKMPDGTLRAYVRGLNNGLWEAVKAPGGPWNGWSSVTSALGVAGIGGSPSAAIMDGRVVVCSRNLNGAGLATFKLSDHWAYADNGGRFAGSPTATANGVFVRDSQGRLAKFDGLSWFVLGGELD